MAWNKNNQEGNKKTDDIDSSTMSKQHLQYFP